MVSKKSFTLLVASGTRPFFAFVSIISVNGCSFEDMYTTKVNDNHLEFFNFAFCRSTKLYTDRAYFVYLKVRNFRGNLISRVGKNSFFAGI